MTEKKEKYEAKELTTEDARRLLAEERDQRLRACNAAIQQALQRYGYELVAVVTITGGQVSSTVQLREAR